jgi:hypothetical protein
MQTAFRLPLQSGRLKEDQGVCCLVRDDKAPASSGNGFGVDDAAGDVRNGGPADFTKQSHCLNFRRPARRFRLTKQIRLLRPSARLVHGRLPKSENNWKGHAGSEESWAPFWCDILSQASLRWIKERRPERHIFFQ